MAGSLVGHGTEPDETGIVGESDQFEGVHGVAHADGHGGVVGVNDNPKGGPGVFGTAAGTGVWGASQTWMGVYGHSDSTTGGAGVMGEAVGPGVIGKSQTWHGVYGETASTTGGAAVAGEHRAAGAGVAGKSDLGNGVVGNGKTGAYFEGAFEGVHAVSHDKSAAGVAGYNDNTGPGIYGKSTGGGAAGFFDGIVVVTGDVQLTGADLAEHFGVTEIGDVEPGTVMVLEGVDRVRVSDSSYDCKVAGVISGAGEYRPGVVLDHKGHMTNRQPLALVGKVLCKVDASAGPIEVGDLLTTSSTPGHAMKAVDPNRAFGAVLGKAMGSCAAGVGVVPVLVALH